MISEDSDLLVYGCPRVIFKLKEYGQGEMIEITNIVGEKNTLLIPEDCKKKMDAAKKDVERDLKRLDGEE